MSVSGYFGLCCILVKTKVDSVWVELVPFAANEQNEFCVCFVCFVCLFVKKGRSQAIRSTKNTRRKHIFSFVS